MKNVSDHPQVRRTLWTLFWLGLIIFPFAPLFWVALLLVLAIYQWGPPKPEA